MVLAATLNALKIVKKKLAHIRIVIAGAGAAGVACTKILMAAGARQIVVCDRHGIIGRKRLPELDASKTWLAGHTNPRNMQRQHSRRPARSPPVHRGERPRRGHASRHPAHGPRRDRVRPGQSHARDHARAGRAYARIIATGRSDYANQINNVLAFPGIFRGALDARARDINEAMKVAAAKAIAGTISAAELSEEYIVPGIFNKQVTRRVARAVEAAAHESGVARKKR